MQNLYDEYASLDAQIAGLEAKKDQLRPLILKQMVDNGQEKIETAVGKFSITRLKKWTYPERVLEIGEKFKEEKAKSESTGEATYIENESLRFTQIKL
jgi:hypothetical protein